MEPAGNDPQDPIVISDNEMDQDDDDDHHGASGSGTGTDKRKPAPSRVSASAASAAAAASPSSIFSILWSLPSTVLGNNADRKYPSAPRRSASAPAAIVYSASAPPRPPAGKDHDDDDDNDVEAELMGYETDIQPDQDNDSQRTVSISRAPNGQAVDSSPATVPSSQPELDAMFLARDEAAAAAAAAAPTRPAVAAAAAAEDDEGPLCHVCHQSLVGAQHSYCDAESL